MLDRINSLISDIINHHPRIIIWGTGQLMLKLLAETSLAKADVVAFVDSNPINQGKYIKDVLVIAPEEVESYPNFPIVITTTLHSEAIKQRIQELQLGNQAIVLDLPGA
jgi:FlaA1/EpsC-like NDP-sugar epimerase